jgi:hypothetical protein
METVGQISVHLYMVKYQKIFTLKCQTPIKWSIYGQLNIHSDFNSGSCGGFNHSKSETP